VIVHQPLSFNNFDLLFTAVSLVLSHLKGEPFGHFCVHLLNFFGFFFFSFRLFLVLFGMFCLLGSQLGLILSKLLFSFVFRRHPESFNLHYAAFVPRFSFLVNGGFGETTDHLTQDFV